MSETLRIQPTHPSQGAWVEIDAADFDPAVHVLVEAVPPPPKPGGKTKKPETAKEGL